MSWRRRKDDEWKKWKEMFPWLPFDLFEQSGFFDDDFMDNMMKEIDRMVRSIDSTDPETARKRLGPMVWGWNVSIGPDGKPTFKEFGNVRPSRGGAPVASKDREPLVDVFIEDKIVRIIGELPGVSKNDIKVTATEDSVTIRAETEERNYHAKRDLSVKIKPKTASAIYKNGILELTVDREEPAESDEGFEVKIE
jgi:HSP20 family protein